MENKTIKDILSLDSEKLKALKKIEDAYSSIENMPICEIGFEKEYNRMYIGLENGVFITSVIGLGIEYIFYDENAEHEEYFELGGDTYEEALELMNRLKKPQSL